MTSEAPRDRQTDLLFELRILMTPYASRATNTDLLFELRGARCEQLRADPFAARAAARVAVRRLERRLDVAALRGRAAAAAVVFFIVVVDFVATRTRCVFVVVDFIATHTPAATVMFVAGAVFFGVLSRRTRTHTHLR